MDKVAVASTVFKGLCKVIKKDRGHRVEVLKTYTAGEFSKTAYGLEIPDYECDKFTIKSRVLTINAGAWDIDGASLCPDKIGSFDLARGYIPHDLGYLELENMAADDTWKQAGWDLEKVRNLWDDVFGKCLGHEASKQKGIWKPGATLFTRLCYNVVRWLGGLFHTTMIAKAILVVVLCNPLMGFVAGCAVPENIFTPSDDKIEYKVVDEGYTTSM